MIDKEAEKYEIAKQIFINQFLRMPKSVSVTTGEFDQPSEEQVKAHVKKQTDAALEYADYAVEYLTGGK